MDILNSLWVEKYRPKKIDDLILPTEYSERFKNYIRNNDIPSLLLYGPPGTGKSTIARIITSENGIIKNGKTNVLLLNGSAQENRGINFVSNVIEPFLKIPVGSPDKLKIVFIDEADYLTDHAFHSLRAIIEKYSSTNRFILTCNYVNNIPEALQSRLTEYKFQLVPVEYITDFCKNILKLEEIEYDENDLSYIITFMYPDIRKIIDTLQKFSLNKKLEIDKNAIITYENIIITKFVEIIQNIIDNNTSQNSKNIKILIDNINTHAYEIDFRKIYDDLFNKDKIPPFVKIKVNKYAINHKNCLSPSMNFMALLFDSIEETKKYINLVNK